MERKRMGNTNRKQAVSKAVEMLIELKVSGVIRESLDLKDQTAAQLEALVEALGIAFLRGQECGARLPGRTDPGAVAEDIRDGLADAFLAGACWLDDRPIVSFTLDTVRSAGLVWSTGVEGRKAAERIQLGKR
jgi:hypothetical protein